MFADHLWILVKYAMVGLHNSYKFFSCAISIITCSLLSSIQNQTNIYLMFACLISNSKHYPKFNDCSGVVIGFNLCCVKDVAWQPA